MLGKFHKLCCKKNAVKRLTQAKREKCISLCRHTTVQACMQLQILRFFVDLPRENCSVTIFRTLRFSVTSLYFSVNRGGFRIQRILRKLRKVEVATTFYTLLFFVTFWFASLTRRGLRIQQIQRKWRKIGAATIFHTSRFLSASFLS